MASVFDWYNNLLQPGWGQAQAPMQDPTQSWTDMQQGTAGTAAPPGVLNYMQDVLSGRVASQGVLNQQRPAYDLDKPLRENLPQISDQAIDIAMGIGPGAIRPRATSTVAGKGVQQANPDVAAPQIGLGTEQPLFNLENLQVRPDVPQTGVARLPDPAKGVPDWWKRQIEDPATAEQYKTILQKGRDVAGDENALGWWNTFPLRDRTIGEFGEAAGDPRWRSDMRLL